MLSYLKEKLRGYDRGKIRRQSMRTEWILAVSILGAVVVLIAFCIGYYRGKRRALEMMDEPAGYYVMANFYLALVKALDENKLNLVRDGIAMMARNQVYLWKMHERSLPPRRLEEIKKRVKNLGLIEDAEKLCGAIDFPDKPKPCPWFHFAEKMLSDLRGDLND
jgi:hypothetical protein